MERGPGMSHTPNFPTSLNQASLFPGPQPRAVNANTLLELEKPQAVTSDGDLLELKPCMKFSAHFCRVRFLKVKFCTHN